MTRPLLTPSKAPAIGLLLLALLPACSSTPAPTPSPLQADTIYTGGDILTMRGPSPEYVESLAVKDGRITYAGPASGLGPVSGPHTRRVDLAGKTLLPGFLDAHSHFINALSVAVQANVYAAPFGPGNTVDGIIGAIKDLQRSQKIPAGQIIMAYGYDENAVDRPLTAADLDSHFTDNPVMVGHVSLHGAVLNSVALKKFGITAQTPTPPGGVIVRKPGSQEPEGLLMETAFLPIFAQLPKPDQAALAQALVKGQEIYAAAGITTAQEGATHLADLKILQDGAASGRLTLDVIAYPFITEFDAIMQDSPALAFGVYNGHLKVGGVKITSDGSPQGKTAAFTTPYLTGGPGGEQNWKGELTFPPAALQTMVKKVLDAKLDLIVHCNGDAAIDEFLKAYELALGDRVHEDRRTAVIHSQFVRPDQLAKYKAYHIIPSFYTEHTYFFGSTHIKQRGRAQTEFLSPMRAALDMGIRCGNHTDFNVAPIDQLFVVWSAVNRVSREGEVIGPDQRITPFEALQAITVHPAYWYREEGRKGTLEAGKLADLVILDKNPLKVAPMSIKEIKVLSTIKEGRTIYTYDASRPVAAFGAMGVHNCCETAGSENAVSSGSVAALVGITQR